MSNLDFKFAINAYIDLAKTYINIEKALYGQWTREGKTEDNLNIILETLLKDYIGPSFHSDYVFDDVIDYIDKCIDGKQFNIDILNQIVNDALEAEATDALVQMSSTEANDDWNIN